jgi:hypothetical protein
MLAEKAKLSNCTVLNPLWLIAGPRKKTEAEILHLTEDGWGIQPVHPNKALYERLAKSIVAECLIGDRLPPGPKQEGIGLLSDIPEWQRTYSSYRGKRPAGQSFGSRGKYLRRN